MAVDVPKADIHELSSRYHVHCEVRPYYVVWDQRPESAPEVEQKVQAGFTVDLYATLEKCQVPLFDIEDARMAVEYFNALAQKIQARPETTVRSEVIPYRGSLVLDGLRGRGRTRSWMASARRRGSIDRLTDDVLVDRASGPGTHQDTHAPCGRLGRGRVARARAYPKRPAEC